MMQMLALSIMVLDFNFNSKLKKLIINFLSLPLLLLLNSCGGGGGGGGINYTPEYNAQEGLNLIGAGAVNDAGYTGSGIKVAVVGTGIDYLHPAFSGTSSWGPGRDWAGTGDAWYDGDGHETHVGSIIAARKDASGMRGVAYDAILSSYKVANNSGSYIGIDTDSEWASVANAHVTDSLKISNNSWGSSTSINNTSTSWINSNYSSTVTALQNAVSNGVIFVFATGNDYRTTPAWTSAIPYRISNLEDGWLAVTAVDLNLQETDYTNRCGLAADFCVTAPGGGLASDESLGIYAAKANTNDYIRYSGTSMAAPHVSGMLANLFQKFPSLTSAQIRTRILNSATYAGLTDTSGNSSSSLSTSQKEAIWGHGLIQEGAALNSMGNYVYSKTSNYNDNNHFNLSQNKFNLPAGISNSLKEKILNEKFGVFDNFDGAYFEIYGNEFFKNENTYTNKLSYNNSNILNFKKENMNTNILFSNNLKYKKTFDLLYYSEGPNFTMTTNQQWGDKNNFLPQSNLFKQKKSLQLETVLLQNKFNTNLNTFFQYSNNNQGINGYGINLKNQISENLKLLSSISKIESLKTNFSISNEEIIHDLTTKNLDYGLQYILNNKFMGFYRNKISTLNKIPTSNFNFGMDNAIIESSVLGIEYIPSDNKKITIGLFKPSHFTSGNLNIITPSGKDRDGNINWKYVNIAINENPDYKLFFSSLFSINDNTGIEINLQQSENSSNFLNYGEIKLKYRF